MCVLLLRCHLKIIEPILYYTSTFTTLWAKIQQILHLRQYAWNIILFSRNEKKKNISVLHAENFIQSVKHSAFNAVNDHTHFLGLGQVQCISESLEMVHTS